MRRVVADFLEPRLCRDAVLVVSTPVEADGLDFLRRGLVWSVDYKQGRLVGDVGTWNVLAGGRLDLIGRFLDAGGEQYNEPLRRAYRGERLPADQRAALQPYDRALALLADRAHGHPIDHAEVDAVAGLVSEHTRGELRALIDTPVGELRAPLTDEPIAPLTSSREYLTPYDYVSTGDHAGCMTHLAALLDEAEALAAAGAEPERRRWRRIALMTRFLTGDDELAMSRLERARIADLRDEWIELFGPLGAARVRREQDDVQATIERAFDGVPFPGPKHRSLYQAEAADNWAGCDQSRDHQGRWQDLPREHLLACQFALPHLDAHGLRYYLAAVMSFAVRERDQPRDDHGSRWLFESLEYTFQFSFDEGSRVAYLRDRFSLFTPAQLDAVARFLEYYPSRAADRARWRALADGGEWPSR